MVTLMQSSGWWRRCLVYVALLDHGHISGQMLHALVSDHTITLHLS